MNRYRYRLSWVCYSMAVTAGLGLATAQVNAQGRTDTVAVTGQQAPGTPAGVVFGSSFPSHVERASILNDSGQVAYRALLAGPEITDANNAGIWRDQTLMARTGDPAPGMVEVDFAGLGTPSLNSAGQVAYHGILTGTGIDDTNDLSLWLGDTLIARKGDPDPGPMPGGNIFGFSDPRLNDAGQVAYLVFIAQNATITDFAIMRDNGLIAHTNTPAPGTPEGVSFFLLHDPRLNNAGQVAYRAQLTGTGITDSNNIGIWRDDAIIAQAGDPAPGTSGGTSFGFFTDPVLNDAGQVAYHATLTGTGVTDTNNTGVWRDSTLIAREAEPAPGTSAGTLFKRFEAKPAIDTAGQVVYQAELSGPGVTSSNATGIWRDDTLVVRAGDPAAGTGPGVQLGPFVTPVTRPALNANGQIAYRTALVGTGVTEANDAGIWIVGPQGDTLLVARKGDALAGQTITDLQHATGSGDSNGQPGSLNNHSQLAYSATLSGGGRGVFLFTPDLHWRSTSSGNWGDADRWTISQQPAHVHDVFVDPSVSLTVAGPAADTTVRSLTVGGSTGHATLQLQPDATLTALTQATFKAATTLTGSGTINAPTVFESGSTANVLTDQTITLAQPVTMEAGSAIHITGGHLIAHAIDNTANADLNLDSGTLTLNGPAASQLTTGANFSIDDPTHETLNIQGNAQAIIDGRLYAGFDGMGTVAITEGQVTNTSGFIGHRSTATGLVTVDGPNAAWENTSSLFVGNTGEGTLNLLNGGSVTSNKATVGDDTGSAGWMTVSGQGTSWTTTDELEIADNGSATVDIENKASVFSHSVVLANGSSAQASATVEGSGTSWTITSDLVVADSGQATLTLQGGASVSSTTTSIAGNSGSSGEVIVDGSTTRWENNGDWVVGDRGTGLLRIENESQVINTGNLEVAPSGQGTLTLASGASLDVHQNLAIGANGVVEISGASLHAGSATNLNQINASESQLDFGTGLTNAKDLTLRQTQIHGPVHSPAGSTIGVETEAVFHGRVSGSGQIQDIGTSSTVFFNAQHSPGDGIDAVSIEPNAAYASTATLIIEFATPTLGGDAIPGTDFDQVNATQGVALDGTLGLSLLNGFTPNYGDTFDILTYASRGGVFQQVTGHFLSPVLALAPFYDLTPNTLTLLATAPGDANGDLIVDITDFGMLAGNFNQPGTWEQGDFNGDGITNITDFGLLAANFNGDFNDLAAAAAASGITTIPQPGAVGVWACLAMAIANRRRRVPGDRPPGCV